MSQPPFVQQQPGMPQVAASQKLHRSPGMLIALVFIALLFVAALSFGIWAFGSREDYKNGSDKKVAAAVQTAEATLTAKKDAEFAEQAKLPNKIYKTTETYGAISITYPKTWSVYAVEASTSSNPIDVYFQPDFVPNIEGKTDFALRLEVLSQSYATVMKKYESTQKSGKVTIAPYNAPKVAGVLGSKLDGEFATDKKGTMIILPLRDKTIQLWTESTSFSTDFTNTILANLTFQP